MAPASRLGTALSSFILDGVAGVLPVLWLGWLLYLAMQVRREVARLGRTPNGTPDPTDGLMILHGVVDAVSNENPASPLVSVTIEQSGTLMNLPGQRRMRWVEVSRKESFSPFEVLLPTGTRMRVKPGTQVVLRRSLEVQPGAVPTRRKRSAKLMRGARVYVLGSVGAEGAKSTSLRPLNDRPITVSDEPPAARPTRKLLQLSALIAVGVVMLGLSQFVLAADFRALQSHGVVLQADVVNLRGAPYFTITAMAAGGRGLVSDDTNERVYTSMQGTPRVPFTCLPGPLGACQIGDRELGISKLLGFGLVAAWIAHVLAHFLLAWRARAWDEITPLTETEAWFG